MPLFLSFPQIHYPYLKNPSKKFCFFLCATPRIFLTFFEDILFKYFIETWKLRYSGFKNFVTRSVFGELQLAQILNFKTSRCNLKVRDLGAKLCVVFLLF